MIILGPERKKSFSEKAPACPPGGPFSSLTPFLPSLLQNNPVTANLFENGIEISNQPYMLIIRPLRWRLSITD